MIDSPRAASPRIVRASSKPAISAAALPKLRRKRTAFTEAKGNIQFRRDVYGRDQKVWEALADAGVALRAVRG